MPPPRTQVKLNIYDMYWINDYASFLGVGVYHSGVEVHGVEYAYGGHPFEFSGIFENQPGDAEELGENFKFKESQICGETDFTAYEIRKIIQQLGEDYRGDRYHLINRNCNHFSQMLVKMLTGTDIPPWVNRLASMSGSIPFFERVVPPEWLTPVALQNSLDEKNKKPEEPVTMNYPVEDAQEALEGHNPNISKDSSNFSGYSNGSSHKSRRSSKEDSTASLFNGARSTPTSARSAPGGSSSGLSKLWNSIKSLASDAPSSSTPPPTTSFMVSAPNTPPPVKIEAQRKTLQTSIQGGEPESKPSQTSLSEKDKKSEDSVPVNDSVREDQKVVETQNPSITKDSNNFSNYSNGSLKESRQVSKEKSTRSPATHPSINHDIPKNNSESSQ